MENNRKCLKTDGDGHWFCIPVSEKQEFEKLREESYVNDDFEVFDRMYSRFRIQSPYSITFTEVKENAN